MSIKYYTDANIDNLVYFQTPKLLLLGEKYKKMNPNAKLLYILLLDRVKLSMLNGWRDEEGRYYVRLSVEKGADLLGFSESTFKRAKKELTKYNLLEEKRDGLTMANRLFVGRLEFTDEDIYKVNDEVDDALKDEELHAQFVDGTLKGQKELSVKSLKGQNEPTGEFKKNQQIGSKRTTINNNSINNETINNKNNKAHTLEKKDSNNKEPTVEENVVVENKLESFLKENKIKVNKKTLTHWRSMAKDEIILNAVKCALDKPNVQNTVGYITGMLSNGYEQSRALSDVPNYILNQAESGYSKNQYEISKDDRIQTLDMLRKLGEISDEEYSRQLEQLNRG